MNFRSAQATTTSEEAHSAEHAGGTLALERHGIAHVPTSRRYGNPRNQFTVRFAPVIYLAGIFLGASGGPLGLGFTGSVTAIVLANILGSIVTGLCAVMGPRLGMPQLPMGRAPFGYYGNFLPAILSLLIFIGYYSVGTVLGAKSLAGLFNTPYAPTVVVVAVLSIVIGIFGYRILHTMGKIITNVSIVVLTVVSIFLLVHGGGPGTDATASGSDFWLAWFVLFTAVFGYTASWAPYASDYSRYLPRGQQAEVDLHRSHARLVHLVHVDDVPRGRADHARTRWRRARHVLLGDAGLAALRRAAHVGPIGHSSQLREPLQRCDGHADV